MKPGGHTIESRADARLSKFPYVFGYALNRGR